MDALQLLNSPVPKRPHPNGITWATRTSASDDAWQGICYGHAGFAAVATTTTPNFVMTSVNGTTGWTLRSVPDAGLDLSLIGIGYGGGTYVAVANAGTQRVRTSTDAATWTAVSASIANTWRAVAYSPSLGRWAAVAGSGTSTRVMTSDDNGATWTTRTSPATLGDISWRAIGWGGGVFVAVADTGVTQRVMTSPDGINWTMRDAAADNSWRGVAWGNGVWVACAVTGTGTRIMYSLDNGVTWTIAETPPADNDWRAITWANGLFVICSVTGTANRIATSPNGRVWTARSTTGIDNNWVGLAYGDGKFAAVSLTGTATRVMTCQD